MELRLSGWAVCQVNRREEAFQAEASMQNQNHEEYRQAPEGSSPRKGMRHFHISQKEKQKIWKTIWPSLGEMEVI